MPNDGLAEDALSNLLCTCLQWSSSASVELSTLWWSVEFEQPEPACRIFLAGGLERIG